MDLSAFKADYDSKINQALLTTSSPTFSSIYIGANCQISTAGSDLLYTGDSLQLAGGIFAGANSSFSGVLSLSGRVGAEVTTLQLIRGANNYGWNYRLAFVPYTGDGALSDSKPSWYFQAGYSSHELNVKHWNGSVESTVMQFLVDKSINIVNGLTVGGTLGVTGNVSAASVVIPGTINTTITNEAGTGAIRITAGANGYVTIGPLNSSALHIYTDRGAFVFNKTICSVDANSELGNTTYPWKALRLNGSIYNNGQLFLDSARNVTLGAGNITTTGAISGGSLSLSGNASQGGLRWLGDGRRIYAKDYPFNCTASANYCSTHNAEKSYTWLTGYQKQKTITMINGLGPGTYRVYFEIAANTTVGVVYGRVYKNGVAIGTARSKTGNTYTGYTEDFSGPLEPGDTIELWCYQYGGDGYGGKCRNFRIGYDLGLPAAMPSTNS